MPMKAVFAFFALSIAVAEPTTQVALEFNAGRFLIRASDKTFVEPVDRRADEPPREPLDRVVFRKDDAYAVWDSRGLSIRKGRHVSTTRLSAVSLSPKTLTAEEIHTNKLMFALASRSPGANALSGSKRIGNLAYFLVRWDDWMGQPWLEALVAVDLAADLPEPQVLGRFEGYSAPMEGLENRLFALDGKPAVVTVSSDGGWGVATYDPEDFAFVWKGLGKDLETIGLTSGTVGYSVQRTSYGTRLFGRFDLAGPNTRPLMETRGTVKLLDSKTPWLAVAHDDMGVWLHNLETGAKLRVPDVGAVRRTPMGVLAWSPSNTPTQATLYDVVRFERLATWSAGGPVTKAQSGSFAKGVPRARHAPTR